MIAALLAQLAAGGAGKALVGAILGLVGAKGWAAPDAAGRPTSALGDAAGKAVAVLANGAVALGSAWLMNRAELAPLADLGPATVGQGAAGLLLAAQAGANAVTSQLIHEQWKALRPER